jgi:hypothetical protein
MCKEMPVIPVNRVVGKKIMIRKNGGPRMMRRHTGLLIQKILEVPILLINYLGSREAQSEVLEFGILK